MFLLSSRSAPSLSTSPTYHKSLNIHLSKARPSSASMLHLLRKSTAKFLSHSGIFQQQICISHKVHQCFRHKSHWKFLLGTVFRCRSSLFFEASQEFALHRSLCTPTLSSSTHQRTFSSLWSHFGISPKFCL